jgi:tRNA pseudouridine38-40 synthase
MKRSFRIVVEYDGAKFHGWQVQPDARTVQGELEKALETVTKHKVRVQGAGRTDAGVHAEGQVAGFRLEGESPDPEKLLASLNALTGEDVAVLSIEQVPEDFSARSGVVMKTYRYRIWNARFRSPLQRRTHFHVSSELDVERMSEAARRLEGEHDFTSFRAADCTDPRPVRTVQSCRVTRQGPEIVIEVRGKGFLKNMVRIMAGTLLLAGKGKLGPEDIASILEARDRTKAGPTAPAHGLVLVSIEYGQI